MLREITKVAIIGLIWAFLCWLAYRYSPVLGYSAALACVVLHVLIAWSDYRQKKRLQASERFLTHLACPECGTLFGDEVARLAVYPTIHQSSLREIFQGEFILGDDFGISPITCDSCSRDYAYHRNIACLQWKDDNGEIRRVQLDDEDAGET